MLGARRVPGQEHDEEGGGSTIARHNGWWVLVPSPRSRKIQDVALFEQNVGLWYGTGLFRGEMCLWVFVSKSGPLGWPFFYMSSSQSRGNRSQLGEILQQTKITETPFLETGCSPRCQEARLKSWPLFIGGYKFLATSHCVLTPERKSVGATRDAERLA